MYLHGGMNFWSERFSRKVFDNYRRIFLLAVEYKLFGGVKSLKHKQAFGISQGCPLSPFLFSMLLTVLLHDASDNAQPCCDELWANSYLQMRHSLSPQARQGQDRYATNRIR